MAITFNPVATTTPQNSFLTQTEGYTQGLIYDDPVPFLWIETGFLASGVTGSVYAGTALSLSVPPINQNNLGPSLTLATSMANLSGFLIGNKAYNAIVTPGATVPVLSAGMSGPLVKLGTGARLAVACNSTLAAALSGGFINQQVAWDFTAQELIAFVSGTALPVKVLSVNSNSKLVNPNSGSPVWTTGDVAIIQI